MTEFKAYSSIENSYRDKEIGRIRAERLDEVEWIALEKVHGANFGLWIIDGSMFVDGWMCYKGRDRSYQRENAIL